MVCLKADAERLESLTGGNFRASCFVDEDLNDMRTAIAVGPFERDVGDEMFGDLSLA